MSTSKRSIPIAKADRGRPARPPRFVFFAGKGGVGKTTCASAYAVRASTSAARHASPGRVLVVSTDPAHSLGDVLGVALTGSPRRVRAGLDAVEIDAARAFARWMREHRGALGEILEEGTWLDREDVDALLDLSVPGIDELAGILEIARFADVDAGRRVSSRRYALIVVDTAPTGHALRLLAAPDTVAAIAGVFDALRREHRLIFDQLARVGARADAADRLIALLAEQARETARRLRDPAQTSFNWVTLAEDLPLAESEDGVAALERGGMHVGRIVINAVLPDGPACRLCDPRRAEQRRVIARSRRVLGRGREVRIALAQPTEPRALGKRGTTPFPRRSAESGLISAGLPSRPPFRDVRVEKGAVPLFRRALLFFGGKGGVGKTTVSAAVALRLANANPHRRVLLLSTDPAHSLGDVFKTTVTDTPAPVAGAPANLYVRELDAAGALAVRRREIEDALDEIAAAFGADSGSSSGVAVHGVSAPASELMRLAPPGIDELFGVLSVVDARDAYDAILVDMAPTGHALRLLETPDAAREWLQVLLRMLLKYRSLVRPGRLAGELVAVSKSIRQLQAMLRDPAQTQFIVVTRAAEVPRRETARLLTRLRRLHLASSVVIANALTPTPGPCPWCRQVAAAEARELARLRRICPRRCAIIQTPLVAPAPRGAAALSLWADAWLPDTRQLS